MNALYDKQLDLHTEMKDLIRLRDEKYMEKVTTLASGKGFGELALKRERLMPRAATIQCLTNCHLAVMTKSDYQKVLSRIEARNLKKLIEFFKSIPFMSKNSKTILTKLHYSFEQKYFIRKQVVYKEGDKSDWVYLVKSGEFEVTKKLKVQLKKNCDENMAECKKLLGAQNWKLDMSSNKLSQHNQFSRKNLKTNQQKLAIQTFRVAIRGVGQLFGEEDVVVEKSGDKRRYTYSVICISDIAEVYAMKYDEFIRKFKSNKESWKTILEQVDEKERVMNKRYFRIIR